MLLKYDDFTCWVGEWMAWVCMYGVMVCGARSYWAEVGRFGFGEVWREGKHQSRLVTVLG